MLNLPLSLIPWVDQAVHLLIPASFVFHAVLAFHIYRRSRGGHCCEEETRERRWFWVSLALLTLSTLFHLSPWHSFLLQGY